MYQLLSRGGTLSPHHEEQLMRRSISIVPFIALVGVGCSLGAVPTDGPRDTPAGTEVSSALVTDAPAPPDPTATPTATVSSTVAPPTSSPAPTSQVPGPSPDREVAEVYLRGPFGSLDGEVSSLGANAEPASLRRLDQHAQGANLSIALRDVQLVFLHWRVSISPVDDPPGGTPIVLSEGPAPEDRTDYIGLVGPKAGDWLLRMDARIAGSPAVSYHWRLAVPERDMPANGELEVPAPKLLIEAGRQSVAAEMGGGCYVYTCGDVGGLTPARLLPRVAADEGRITVKLSDGSGFVEWRASGWPVDGKPHDSRSFGRGKAPEGIHQQTVSLPRGDWYLKVELAYDLERGHGTYFARVTVK